MEVKLFQNTEDLTLSPIHSCDIGILKFKLRCSFYFPLPTERHRLSTLHLTSYPFASGLEVVTRVLLTSSMCRKGSCFDFSMFSLRPILFLLFTCFLNVHLSPVGAATCQKWSTGGTKGQEVRGAHPSVLPGL